MVRQLGVFKGSGSYGGGSGLQSLYILLAALVRPHNNSNKFDLYNHVIFISNVIYETSVTQI